MVRTVLVVFPADKLKRQTACKPGSVLASRRGMAIHLGRPLPDASRDRPGRRRGNPLGPSSAKIWGLPSLLGLAPGGVCPATAVAGGAVRSYRTISPLPPAACLAAGVGLGGMFLWHFPWGRPRRALPGTVFPWSPDFPPPALRRKAAIRPSGARILGLAAERRYRRDKAGFRVRRVPLIRGSAPTKLLRES
jgi:hypothetical protein